MFFNHKYYFYIILFVVVLGAAAAAAAASHHHTESFKVNHIQQPPQRMVRYGDTITLWSSSVKKFIQGHKKNKNKINLSPPFISPEDISNRVQPWAHFVLVDPKAPNNTGPVLYGGPVLLKTAPPHTFLSAMDNDDTLHIGPKKQVWMFESLKRKKGESLYYGDMLSLSFLSFLLQKKEQKKYMSVVQNNENENENEEEEKVVVVVVDEKKKNDRYFHIYDHLGQGRNVEWVRRGTTSTSTSNTNQKEANPWWEVTLPRDIVISRMTFQNQSKNDDTTTQRHYEIQLMENEKVTHMIKSNTETISWENINHIARRVRIVQKAQVTEEPLSLTNVKIYGQAVDYNVLLDEEISKSIIEAPTHFGPARSLYFSAHTLPHVLTDMTVMFMLQLDELPRNPTHIYRTATHQLILQPPASAQHNYSTLQYCRFHKDKNECFDISSFQVVAHKMFHFAAAHNGGINPLNDWILCHLPSSSDTSSYLCNFATRAYYKYNKNHSHGTIYTREISIPITAEQLDQFQLKGTFVEKDMATPTLTIYINGQPHLTNMSQHHQHHQKENSKHESMTVGAFDTYSGFNGTISFFKFTNRVIPPEYITKEAQLLTGKMSLQLVSEPRPTPLHFERNRLPTATAGSSGYTIHMWVNYEPSSAPDNVTLFSHGAQDGLILQGGTILKIKHDNDNDKNNDNNKNKNNIVFPTRQWTHVAYVRRHHDDSIRVFINGKSVAVSKAVAAASKAVATNGLTIGFRGLVSHVTFADYALKKKEIAVLMHGGPLQDAITRLQRAFKEMDCPHKPVKFNTAWLPLAKDVPTLKKKLIQLKSQKDALFLKTCYGPITITKPPKITITKPPRITKEQNIAAMNQKIKTIQKELVLSNKTMSRSQMDNLSLSLRPTRHQ